MNELSDRLRMMMQSTEGSEPPIGGTTKPGERDQAAVEAAWCKLKSSVEKHETEIQALCSKVEVLEGAALNVSEKSQA